MLAGGITVGAQGFVPEAYADHNANLFVSAEKTGSFHGLQIVEVVIRDDDLSDSSVPTVTVNGDNLFMVEAYDGHHYAYFASADVRDADKAKGLDFGNCYISHGDCVNNVSGDGSADDPFVIAASLDDELGNVLQSAERAAPVSLVDDNDATITDSNGNDVSDIWPFIQLFDFSGTVEIEYKRAGGAELTSLKFEDGSNGMTLDRSSYPSGAHVHTSIDDHRLNIDPTTRDTWTWIAAGTDKGEMHYNLDAQESSPVVIRSDDVGVNSDAVCGECSLTISANKVLGTESATDRPLIEAPSVRADADFISVSVRETATNSAVFTTTDINDSSTIRILDDAARGTSGVLSYDGTSNSIGVKHYTASISIDAPTDVWPSGLDVPVAVVDDDINKNSLADDDIAVSNPNSIIPTLVTGDPFTLSELSDNSVTTWVGWNIADSNAALEILNGDGYDDAFEIKGFEQNQETNAYGEDFDDNIAITTNNIVVIKHDANVESFSDRALLTFEDEITLSGGDSDTAAALAALRTVTGNIGTTDEQFANVDFIVIDFENGIDELRNSLINHDSSANGFNFVNYNVESLETDITSIEVIVEATIGDESVVRIVETIDELGNQSGYTSAFDDTTMLFDEELDDAEIVRLKLNFDGTKTVDPTVEYPIVVDFFSFGYENDGDASSERIANQIIRLELEESDTNQGTFEGTLEYVMINQINISDEETFGGISPIDVYASFIVIEDLTGSDAPTVTYYDRGTDGVETQVSAKEDAPSHSGIVTLDVESFKVGDTVTITVEDLDLNVNSELSEVYTVVNDHTTDTKTVFVTTDGAVNYERDSATNAIILRDADGVRTTDGTGEPTVLEREESTKTRGINWDVVGEVHPRIGPAYLGNLLEVTFDDNRWTNYNNPACTGLGATGFTLSESDKSSGVFTGTFQIPADICIDEDGITTSTTGLDIAVNYVDFRDASGETTEVSSDAGVKANTGSVSFDRTVYPVPFADNTFKLDAVDGDEYLTNGDLIVYVSINDPDYDVSASGTDSIAEPKGVLEVSISRDSNEYFLYGDQSVDAGNSGDEGNAVNPRLGSEADPITEIAPDAGIFEASITISANNGPLDGALPKILQGDILRVEYTDLTDASGEENTVTDSATFDLRNGVLQSDKSVYIIGSDMILTLIEPDLDLDSSQNETYDLDLIEWDSSAATVSMGNAGGEITAFDPEPSSLRETGPNTGIFQVVVEIPAELEGDSLQRGEEIELIYVDYGPSGSAFVGENSEDISTTVFTSNFGATVEFDQKIYTWTDKVYMTIVAPDHNFDSKAIDSIGDGDDDEIRISTREGAISNYKLVETGTDTGIFTGEVTLVGDLDHRLINQGSRALEPSGPTSGELETKHGDGISISFEFSEEETVLTSSLIRWNIGEVQWLEASYPASGNGILRIIDPDMSLNPEAVDNFEVDIVSSTDAGGISLAVTETNEATGIFEGTVFFTTSSASSGHRLRIAEGDTVTAYYVDQTLPDPYTTADSIDITATTLIGTIVPPLERAPASDLRVVDPFGNSLSTVSPDQQVQVSANLANGQDRDQDFAYLVQIQDGDGVTVHLAWIAGTLSPGQSFSPAVSWTPSESGTYTVTAFVWESVDNPTALSPPITIDVDVN